MKKTNFGEQLILTNLTTNLEKLNISMVPPNINQPNNFDILMNSNANNHFLILYSLMFIFAVIMIFTLAFKIKHYFCADRNLEKVVRLDRIASQNMNRENNDLPNSFNKKSKKKCKKTNKHRSI